MVFSQKLRELRLSKNLSSDTVANALGISGAGYRYYETDKREPNLTMLCAIAAYFDVSTDYLLGRTAIKDVASKDRPSFEEMLNKRDLTDVEKRFILVYVHLDKKYRNAFVAALEDAADKAKARKAAEQAKIIEFPVSINYASAGSGFDLDSDDFITRTFYKPDDDGDFAVKVEGDSMIPDYPDGCYVLIRKYDDGEYPSVGDVALFMCSDDDDQGEYQGYIKVWRGDNVLHSLNPEYPDVQHNYVKPVGEVRCVIERYRKQ